jgi:hypothetical protein
MAELATTPPDTATFLLINRSTATNSQEKRRELLLLY